jgi:hypothetical protein
MRNRYGRALYGLAAAIAATTTLGLTASGVATASTHTSKADVTPACTYGDYCSDPLFNVLFGIQYFQNVQNDEQKVGNEINLAYANDNNPGEDWRVTQQGSVSSLYKLGWISSAMMVKYKKNQAYEVMWTPYGTESNLCRGLSKNAFEGEVVTLQPCGSFPRTLWIVGENYSAADHVAKTDTSWTPSPYYGGNELISASGQNPSVPYLLTAGGGVWGQNPLASLQVDQQTANDGVLNPAQAFCTATVSYPYTSVPTGPPWIKNDSKVKSDSKVKPDGNHTSSPPSNNVGPPTYTANDPCFPTNNIGWWSTAKG